MMIRLFPRNRHRTEGPEPANLTSMVNCLITLCYHSNLKALANWFLQCDCYIGKYSLPYDLLLLPALHTWLFSPGPDFECPWKDQFPISIPTCSFPAAFLGGSKDLCSCMAGTETEGALPSPSVCSPVHLAAPERWSHQTRHSPAAAPLSLQRWLAEMWKVLVSKCFEKHGSSLPCWGAARAPKDPPNHQACVGLQLTSCKQEGLVFSVSRDLMLCMQPRSRLLAGTRVFVHCCGSWYPAARALPVAPSSGQYWPQQTWRRNGNYS